jgi:phage tail-like protein
MEEPEFLPAFHFSVRFDPGSRIADASFQEVSGIAPEMQTEEYREGGENRFVHMLPKGVKNPRLVLKRGIATADSGLVAWCKAVLEGGLELPIRPQAIEVRLLDADGNPVRNWSFQNAYPVKWSIAEFRSNKNDVALETVEFNYTAVKLG